MSREKQIEEMANAMCNLGESNCQECANHWDFVTVPECDLVKRAEHLYSAGYRKQEWISVEERLPEIKEHHCSDTVLVYFADGSIGFDQLEENCFGGVLFFCEKPSPFGEDEGLEVTHWMPLPSLPEKEKNDD